MKNVGYIRLYRYIALEYKKNLTDQEYRLLEVYACLVRWDKKNPEHFGIVSELSIRDIQKDYLPHWSVGKISTVTKSLIEKNLLTRLPKKRMRVENFWIYQAKPPQAEQGFQLIEQGIQPTEQNIQLAEQNQWSEIRKAREELLGRLNPFRKNVQSTEQNESG
jgi:hypothetical protein